jgi:hypothetical protein
MRNGMTSEPQIYDLARTPNDMDVEALESALAALAVTLLAD